MAASTSQYPQSYLDAYIGDRSLALSIAFIVIVTLVFATRCLCRYVLKRGAQGMEDYIMPAAWLAQLAVWIIPIVGVKRGGLGHHVQEVEMRDPEEVVVIAQLIYALEFAYPSAISLPKLALLSLYLRLFPDKRIQWACYLLISYILAFWVTKIILDFIQCTPIAYNWDTSIPGGYCRINLRAGIEMVGPCEIAPDIPMLIIPSIVIWQLQMSTRRRLGLIGVLSAGLVGTIFGIIRIVIFFMINIKAGDVTWDNVTLTSWNGLEPSLYFIAACLPGCSALGPYLRFESLRSRFTGNARRGDPRYRANDSSDYKGARAYRPSDREHWEIELAGGSLLATGGTEVGLSTQIEQHDLISDAGSVEISTRDEVVAIDKIVVSKDVFVQAMNGKS